MVVDPALAVEVTVIRCGSGSTVIERRALGETIEAVGDTSTAGMKA
jgi:hypothetical protein